MQLHVQVYYYFQQRNSQKYNFYLNYYAIWAEDKGKCTVTFNVNIEGRTESFTKTYQTGIPQLLPECSWTREGYCFMAWDTSSNISYGYKPENQSEIFDKDTVMYASWRKAPVVTFHKNDGTDETKTQYVVYGTDTKLMKNEFTVEGKAFKVWGYYATSTSASWDDETFRIYDAETGKELNVVETDPLINSVSFSPDGKAIISAFDNGTIIIWNADTGKSLKWLEGHTDGVNSASFSPDGKKIVSASDDRTIRIWDAETGKEQKVVYAHDIVYSASFSPDGKHIISVSADGTARIWDTETGMELRKFDGSYISATFSSDGKKIAFGSTDGTILIWDNPSLQQLIDDARERFKDYPLTPEERRKYYLE